MIISFSWLKNVRCFPRKEQEEMTGDRGAGDFYPDCFSHEAMLDKQQNMWMEGKCDGQTSSV